MRMDPGKAAQGGTIRRGGRGNAERKVIGTTGEEAGGMNIPFYEIGRHGDY